MYENESMKICEELLGDLPYEDREKGFKIGDIRIFLEKSKRSEGCIRITGKTHETAFEDSKGNTFSRKDLSENVRFISLLKKTLHDMKARKELNFGRIEMEMYKDSIPEHTKIDNALRGVT